MIGLGVVSCTVEDVLKDTLIGNIIPPSKRVEGKYVPPSLEAVSMKALEYSPGDRYQSVSVLRNEINKWMGGFATEAENAGFFKSLYLLLKRHKAVSSLLLIIFISAVFAFYKIKKNEQAALFNEQKAFIWSVFQRVLKTEMSRHYLRQHSSTKDSQELWKSLVNYHKGKHIGKSEKTRLMKHLTTVKLNRETKGTTLEFITK